jgi:RND family efflux transporter MFP subunit
MKNRSKALGLLLTTLLVIAACGKQEVTTKDEIRPVRALKLTSLEPFGGRWYPGKATATQVANLSFRVSGAVERILVDIGARVTRGDLLARLDPQDYQVALSRARAELRKAEAGFELAGAEYERVVRVYEKDPGAVSKSLVDVRKAQLDSAKAGIVAAQAAVKRARDDLGYTALKAPYDGEVVEKFVEQFEEVQASQQIIRVLDPSRIEFTVNIPETLMENIDKVKEFGAFVVFDAYPDAEVPAQIKEVGREASKTTRTYPVTLIMNQPENFKILPGMAGKAKGNKKATAKIAEQEGLVGIEVPVTATFSDQGQQTFVWVIDENSKKVNKRAVKIINLTQNGALVTGLEQGEMIATAGANMLVEGQQVRILE